MLERKAARTALGVPAPHALRFSVITLLLSMLQIAVAQDCSQITKFGIFDMKRTSQQTDMLDDVIHWLTVNEYQSESTARSAAASVGISIPDVPVPLNADGSYGESHASTWSKATADYLQSHHESHQKLSQDFITANPQIVSAWQSCVTLFGQSGLHTELVQVDACKSSFVAWYKPNSVKDLPPRMVTLAVDGAACDKPSTSRVPYGGFNITCRRNRKDSIVVSLNTNKGNDMRKLESLPEESEPPKQVAGTKFVASPDPKVCKVSRGTPGNAMSYSGTCTAPGPIASAQYGCDGPGCGWCYGLRNDSRGPDWDINGNTLTWYRRCEGWAAALMSYTLSYSTPQDTLVDNPTYDRDYALWTKREQAITCPGIAGSSWHW
jgi:hypothetical protein